MASTHAKTNTSERAAAHANAVPPVESFTTNGDLTLTLNRQQWTNIVGALSMAAAEAATERNYEQMFVYNGICGLVGRGLGIAQQTAAGGDLPPPQSTRAATAS